MDGSFVASEEGEGTHIGHYITHLRSSNEGLGILTLHWAGGTGLFETATGAINGPLELKPTGDLPLMEFSSKGEGAIRH